MEKKQRVPKGEKYWYVFIYCDDVTVDFKIENGRGEDYTRSELGNYFATMEEAETMARKLRAVLKGADVIEMPSEEELEHKATDIAMERKEEFFDEAGEPVLCFSECYDAAADMVKFLKSKIVK